MFGASLLVDKLCSAFGAAVDSLTGFSVVALSLSLTLMCWTDRTGTNEVWLLK